MSSQPIYDLRPLTIGELLDYSLRIYQRSFPFIAIPTLVVSGFVDFPGDYVLRIWDSLVESWTNDPTQYVGMSWAEITSLIFEQTGTDLTWSASYGWTQFWQLLGAVLLYHLLRLLCHGYSSAMVFGVIANRIIGEEVSWHRSRDFAMRFGWRDFQLTLLQELIFYGPFAPALLLVGLARFGADELPVLVSALLALLLAIPIFIWSFSFIVLTDVALVVEDLRPVAALKRAIQLTEGHRWRLLGIMFLAIIILSLFEALLASSSTWLLSLPFPRQAIAIEMIVDTIANVLIWPLTSVFSALLYFDLRVRKENFDLYYFLGENTSTVDAPSD